MTDFARDMRIKSAENDVEEVKKNLALAIQDGTDKQNINWLTARLKHAEDGLKILKDYKAEE